MGVGIDTDETDGALLERREDELEGGSRGGKVNNDNDDLSNGI
jgi:hypothetical protein